MTRSYHPAESVLTHVAILALMTPAVVGQTVDPNNPLKYIPSNALTAIALGKSRTLEA